MQLKIRTYFHAAARNQDAAATRPQASVDESPMLQIDTIEPGETIVERVQVFFPEPGKHVVGGDPARGRRGGRQPPLVRGRIPGA